MQPNGEGMHKTVQISFEPDAFLILIHLRHARNEEKTGYNAIQGPKELAGDDIHALKHDTMADGARVTPSGQSSPAINRKAVPTTKYESEHSSSSLLPKVQDERFTAKSPVSWLRAWWLELTASLFAIACLAANLAILLTINGKPLRSWEVASVSITPNTLISIFSTLAKSSMLLPITEGIGQLKWTFFYQQPHRLRLLQTFDDASRGPLGALDLLWKVNVGAIAASCGAILTVLSLAFDPFTQQILAYPTNVVQAHNYSTPKIPVTEMFTWADKGE